MPLDGMIIDSFAGGGGASTGIEAALGRPIDVAINHDAEALAMHAANHPDTLHLTSNIWRVDPAEVCEGRRVALAWFSPDCKHFSKAKGGRPVKRHIRDLAWVVIHWAKRARPAVIMLENVEEFREWGPVSMDGRPCPDRKGQTFKRFLRELRRLGYRVVFWELRACDYGAPTIRKRLFMVARCDGRPIEKPRATHGAPEDPDVIAGRKLPYRTAAEIIDWSIPCPSIFARKRPLVENTMARIARGIRRFVVEAAEPFIIPVTHQGDLRGHPLGEPIRTVTTAPRGEMALIAPVIARQFGRSTGSGVDDALPTTMPGGSGKSVLVAPMITKFRSGATGHRVEEPLCTVTANSFLKRPGGAPPIGVVAAFLAQHNTGVTGHDVRKPLSTITQSGSHQQLVTSHLLKLRGTCRHGQPVTEPLATITGGGTHLGEVRAFLLKYYGSATGQDLRDPLHSVTSRARFGLVMVEGEPYQIVDIGMRMLQPRELFAAQGFPSAYIIDPVHNGKPLTKTAQVRMCGNSVSPVIAEALVRANFPELSQGSMAA